jgi:NRPS condensation-like uncharacterized protein
MADQEKGVGQGDLRHRLMEQIASMPASQRKKFFAQLRCDDPERQLRTDRNRKGNEFPLSAGQRQLWILQKFDPDSGAYNSCLAVRYRGKLSTGVLETALEYVECRYEILRTSFPLGEEGPVQFVHQPTSGEMRRVDLRSMPRKQAEGWAECFLSRESCRPFDLEQAPLLRKVLLLLDEEDHVLLIVLHHILCDEWSTGILTKEVADVYQAIKSGSASPPVLDAVQYADFAVWQQQNQMALFQGQLEYWTSTLAGLKQMRLPADRQRPEYPSFLGDVLALQLDPNTAAWAIDFARHTGTTLFIVLLTAFQVFLSRWTGEQDIAIGTPVANRNVSVTEMMLGFFVNTVVLRSRIDLAKSFEELVQQVGQNAVEAYANQDIPFEMVVEKLSPSRRFNSSPLFQVMFQIVQASSFTWPDVRVEVLKVPRTTSKFDITLFIREAGRAFLCEWNYATDLFTRETINDAAYQFTALLDAVAVSPDVSLEYLVKRISQRSSATALSQV